MSAIGGERDVLLQATAERFSTLADGKAILMAGATPIFHVDSNGVGAPASIAITAKPVNVVGDIVFTVSAGTALRVNGNVATVDFATMGTDTALVQARIREFGVDYIANYMVSKVFDGKTGDTGLAGLNTGQAFAYKRATVAPIDSPGDVVFTFSTASITTPAGNDLANGWSKNIPAGTAPLYVRVASASSRNAMSNIVSNEWAAAVQLAKDGADGLNVSSVRIFQRGTTNIAPALPTARCTFTFATGALAGLNGGWSTQVPTTGGGYLFTSGATAAGRGATDDIEANEWAAAARLAADGAAGQRGTVTVTAPGYSSWSDASAVYELGLAGYGAPINRDTVTLYDAKNAVTKFFVDGAWLALGTVLNGNLLVDGTVAAKALAVDKLSAVSANLGNVTAGDLYGTTLHGGPGYPTNAYAWPSNGGSGFHLSAAGLLLGNKAAGRYVELRESGDIDTPQFKTVGGKAEFTGDIFTGVAPGFRIEMGPGDPVYAMWAGSGAKNDTNAIFFLKRSGAGYFGGSLSAGTLRTSVTNPTFGPSQSVTTGPFGSNGGSITVVGSIDMTSQETSYNYNFSAGEGSTGCNFTLFRRLGNDAEVPVHTFYLLGVASYDNYGSVDDLSSATRSLNGSFTFVDPVKSTLPRTYRLATAITYQEFKYTKKIGAPPVLDLGGASGQRLTIITTE
ncbi:MULTISPECIES: hypothetical protein [unclassified Janthinobacterium]|uniref:hypothetical protein n=1 Tax=unclassified Janthinobacterium TaxID=2610881 RepID=UPI00161430D4|nr:MULTISPECIES: hypothetical protein [unclassified Janthinobacterium]MBB5610441.1 hypothetical protein [Janthinobacterium sp. S3T4]MBB5615722.1 hypothetical protein [Janthinobacterium sp. S3M3]